MPPQVAQPTRKREVLTVVAPALALIGLLFGIYFNLDGKISRVLDKDEAKLAEFQKQVKVDLEKLDQRLRTVEDGQRSISALCRSFGELEEDRFQAQCVKDGGHYDFRALVCEKKGTAKRFHKLCT